MFIKNKYVKIISLDNDFNPKDCEEKMYLPDETKKIEIHIIRNNEILDKSKIIKIKPDRVYILEYKNNKIIVKEVKNNNKLHFYLNDCQTSDDE